MSGDTYLSVHILEWDCQTPLANCVHGGLPCSVSWLGLFFGGNPAVSLGPFPLADKMPWTEVSQFPAARILGATWERRRGEEAGQEGLSIDHMNLLFLLLSLQYSSHLRGAYFSGLGISCRE